MSTSRSLLASYAAGFCLGALEAVLLVRLQYVRPYSFVLLEIVNVGCVYALVAGTAFFVSGEVLRRLRGTAALASAASVAVVPALLWLRYRKYGLSLEDGPAKLAPPHWAIAAAVFVAIAMTLTFLFRRLPGAERTTHRALWIVTAIGIASIPLLPPGARREEATIRSRPDRPANVVWITSDALRADHMSVYGYDRETTPFAARLREDAVFFPRSYSQCCWTQPSMTSLFTSLYPFESFQMEGSLSPGVVTIAQILSAAGWQTLGLSNNEVVGPSTNLDRGFEVFYRPPRLYAKDRILDYSMLVYFADDFVPAGRLDPLLAAVTFAPQRRLALESRTEHALFDRAMARLDGLREPFFLYLHFMAPHAPYDAEEPWKDWGGVSLPPTGHLLHDARVMPPKDVSDLAREEIVWRYDREIRMLDDYVKRIVDELRARDLYDDCLLVLTSDHGEEFLEHGEWTHGRGLYDESVRVPLLVKLPGNAHGGTEVPWPAQGVDLLPTLLGVLGVEAALPYEVRGDALFEDRGEAIAKLGFRPIVIEFNSHYPDIGDQTAIVLGHHKLIHYVETDRYELYDLQADPRERADLAAVETGKLDELRTMLATVIGEHLHGLYADGPSPLEQQRIQEELRALGYIR